MLNACCEGGHYSQLLWQVNSLTGLINNLLNRLKLPYVSVLQDLIGFFGGTLCRTSLILPPIFIPLELA